MEKSDSAAHLFHYLFGFRRINSPLRWIQVFAIHALAWLLFFCLPLLFFPLHIRGNYFFLKDLANKLFLVVFFYANYFYLVPAYFLRHRRGAYLLLVAACVFLLMAQQVVVEKYFIQQLQAQKSTLEGIWGPAARYWTRAPRPGDTALIRDFPPPPPNAPSGTLFRPRRMLLGVVSNVLSSSFTLILLGGFIHLAQSFFRSQHEKKALENARLQAEIGLLKSQINPHFLFNTLNTIYSQAYQKADNTGQTILKLSEILRYMIDEGTSEYIPLEKDLHYIKSYIDLQRLRVLDKVTINYEVEGDTSYVFITPLLLITFVENAFKHGISYSQASVIDVYVQVVDRTLTLLVRNPVASLKESREGGMGLANARRRLELFYPGAHHLTTLQTEHYYQVNLTINLHDKLHDHR